MRRGRVRRGCRNTRCGRVAEIRGAHGSERAAMGLGAELLGIGSAATVRMACGRPHHWRAAIPAPLVRDSDTPRQVVQRRTRWRPRSAKSQAFRGTT